MNPSPTPPPATPPEHLTEPPGPLKWLRDDERGLATALASDVAPLIPGNRMLNDLLVILNRLVAERATAAALRREVDGLREALEKISTSTDAKATQLHVLPFTAQELRQMAAAALATPTPPEAPTHE